MIQSQPCGLIVKCLRLRQKINLYYDGSVNTTTFVYSILLNFSLFLSINFIKLLATRKLKVSTEQILQNFYFEFWTLFFKILIGNLFWMQIEPNFFKGRDAWNWNSAFEYFNKFTIQYYCCCFRRWPYVNLLHYTSILDLKCWKTIVSVIRGLMD